MYVCWMQANMCSVKDYTNNINVPFTGSHQICQVRYTLSMEKSVNVFSFRFFFFNVLKLTKYLSIYICNFSEKSIGLTCGLDFIFFH